MPQAAPQDQAAQSIAQDIKDKDNSGLTEVAPEPAGGKPRPDTDNETPSFDTNVSSGATPAENAPEVQKLKNGEDLDDEEMKKLELRLANLIDSGIDKIQPILKMINDNVNEAEEQQKKDELNEEEFVKRVKPLIEQGSSILNSVLDQVKALDPNKKIQQQASRNTEDSKATPEQQKIAQGLADLTKNVTETIENAKKKIANMPHAKRELGPLFNMLSQPLFQILSAVGLLVVGVLNLVGNILDALGLGGVVSGIIDGLGLRNILGMFGWKLQLTKTDK